MALYGIFYLFAGGIIVTAGRLVVALIRKERNAYMWLFIMLAIFLLYQTISIIGSAFSAFTLWGFFYVILALSLTFLLIRMIIAIIRHEKNIYLWLYSILGVFILYLILSIIEKSFT